ncbi:surface glycoprotein [Salinibaculum rarum]|uniref:surface glycoprotein n=1 Tax=Salinibaculum rarum TaxID=3058903 RepID=UPI00265DC0F0|nr:surface glycoprotein [Salinibaculum sp. KK48]
MTNRNEKLRSLFLAVLMVFSVFAGTIALSGTAAAVNTADETTYPRGSVQETAANTAPHVVYVGETLNLSNLAKAGGGQIQVGSSITLSGQSGAAEGAVETIADVNSTDFDGFATGTYNASGGSATDIAVVDPKVTSVDVNTKLAEAGADVTDGRFVSDTLYLSPEYNFNQVDKVKLTIENSDGVDITRDIIDPDSGNSSYVHVNSGDVFLTKSNEDVYLDFSGEPNGDYTITVEADDLNATGVSTVTKGDTESTLSLAQQSVTAGERVTTTVTGSPGATPHVRIDQSAAADSYSNNAAADFFRNTGPVTDLNNSTSASGSDYYYANISLGDDGQATFAVKTGNLSTDETHTYELVNSPRGTAQDDADLTVNAPTVTVDSSPSTVATGASFEITGTAPQSDKVVAMAKIDNTWYKINNDGANGNPAIVDGNQEFELALLANNNISLAGTYRIGIADRAEAQAQGDGIGDGVMSETDWGNVNVKTTTSVTVEEGSLSASLSSGTLAVDTTDKLTVNGTALGQGKQIERIIIGPRGNFYNKTLSVSNDNTFSEDFGDASPSLNNRGSYSLYLIGYGANSQLDDGGTLNNLDNGNTYQQNVEIVEEALTTAGSDDMVRDFTFSGASAQLSLDDVGTVPAGEIEVSGTSNREDETTVFIEVVNTENSNIIASTEAEVDGKSSSFSTTLDLSGVESGEYELRADDTSTSDRTTFTVSDAEQAADFQVSNLNPQDVTVSQGDTVDASATVTNEGNVEATQTVEFRIGGQTIGSEEITLAAGADQTVEFTATADLDAGDYTHGVYTDDDSQTATLTVEGDMTPTTPDETATPDEGTATSTPSDGGDGDSDGESGPGFGIMVSVLALLGAALLAARRNN